MKISIRKTEYYFKYCLVTKNKYRYRLKKMVMIIICILLALHCLDGKAYAVCQNIYPDEIMDLQGSFSCLSLVCECHFRFEERHGQLSHALFEIDVASISMIYQVRGYFPQDFFNMLDFQKRLFTFHRYRS